MSKLTSEDFEKVGFGFFLSHEDAIDKLTMDFIKSFEGYTVYQIEESFKKAKTFFESSYVITFQRP